MTAFEMKERLVARFGLGTKPALRMALYERLTQIVEEQGEVALNVIATVVADATGRRDNGKYFAWVVMRRLMDRGIIKQKLDLVWSANPDEEIVLKSRAEVAATK